MNRPVRTPPVRHHVQAGQIPPTLAVTEAALGPDHPDTALRLDAFAATLANLGRAAEALPLR